MKSLKSKLFQKFEKSKLKDLSKCIGGKYEPTYQNGQSDQYHPSTRDIIYNG
jgi:hypothetical protein